MNSSRVVSWGWMDDAPESSSSEVQSVWVVKWSCLSQEQCPATAFLSGWGCSWFLSELLRLGKIWLGGKRRLEVFGPELSVF